MIRRFITVDPAVDGENWYQYCRNNPLRYSDPDGKAIPVIIYMYLTSLAASPDLQLQLVGPQDLFHSGCLSIVKGF